MGGEIIMFIYWGGINGGKIHMRNYAIINSKNVLAWQHIGVVIRKRKFNVNFSPLDSTKPILPLTSETEFLLPVDESGKPFKLSLN